nr:hypothetical protein BaRGS_020563 [Batillaria attramentaria]
MYRLVSDFLQKIQTSDLFKTFFLTVTCEGIEEKNKVQLKRDWVILKNRRCVGTLQEQTVRTKSKPLILDMDERAPEPKFSIVREPSEGHPEFLVAEIHLPQVKTVQTLNLEVGEDRILLETRSNVYHLDIYLPYNLVQEDVGAQFDRSTKQICLTLRAHLPEIFSQGEMDFLVNLSLSHGRHLEFSAWGPGQPDNGGGEHCMELNEEDMKWNDEQCDHEKNFICQTR